jgi:outer membrane protein assembly factor BamA
MNLHRPLLSLTTVMLLMSGIGHAQDTSIRPVFGITADAGFAAGANISRTRLAGPIDGHIKGVFSVKKYQLYEAGIDVPEISRWASLSVSSRYRNYPQEDFWGLGPNTPNSARKNYLMEDLDTTATVTATIDKLRVGASTGYLKINTGPGRDTRYPILPEAYELQPSFGHVGAFVEYKSLDENSDPHKGGSYSFQWTAYLGTFQNYDVDLRYFVPVTASDRIGFRMESWFTHAKPEEQIPFFMLPFVGGTETVRGFSQARFRDRNALLLNSEYRHSLNGFLDVVGFVDAGRVFPNAENFGLRYLHPGYGVGARVKFGSRMFFGIDLGFSSEGRKVYFRSNQMF